MSSKSALILIHKYTHKYWRILNADGFRLFARKCSFLAHRAYRFRIENFRFKKFIVSLFLKLMCALYNVLNFTRSFVVFWTKSLTACRHSQCNFLYLNYLSFLKNTICPFFIQIKCFVPSDDFERNITMLLSCSVKVIS